MLAIFQYHFMVRAFIAGLAIGVTAPLIGMFLVVRRYSLMADTLAHVALFGVALGFLAGFNPLATAAGIAIIAGFGMEKLRNNKRLAGDAVLALFLSGGLALAVILISVAHGFTVSLFSFLFGSISTVSQGDLYFIAVLGLITIIFVAGFYKELFLVSLDDEIARANGVKTQIFNILLVILAALTVSLAIKIVGALLIGALMVIPVIAAIQFREGFGKTISMAILISLVSVILGLYASYYLGWASGGTIVMVAIAIFLLSLLATRKS